MSNIIHCITNEVTKNDVANIVLAANASPIMAHHPEEVCEVQSFSKALLLNLGATYDYDAMLKAAHTANLQGHAIVLDPVGVSGISFRRKFADTLLQERKIDCIRGNKAEIWAIICNSETGSGIDCESNSEVPADDVLLQKMKAFSLERDNMILVASGEMDLVTDGIQAAALAGGDPMMKRVTGMGCMSSGVLAAALAEVDKTGLTAFEAVRKAIDRINKAGEKAAYKTSEINGGTMTFKTLFMDEMSR